MATFTIQVSRQPQTKSYFDLSLTHQGCGGKLMLQRRTHDLMVTCEHCQTKVAAPNPIFGIKLGACNKDGKSREVEGNKLIVFTIV